MAIGWENPLVREVSCIEKKTEVEVGERRQQTLFSNSCSILGFKLTEHPKFHSNFCEVFLRQKQVIGNFIWPPP